MDSSKCEHEFEVIKDDGKYFKKKCKKCPRTIYDLKPEYRPFYKVRPDGCGWCGFNSKETALQEVTDLLDNDNEGLVIIEKVLMTEEEIEALPEFPGY